MKKTIWNATLEESMNLVTDKYLQTSLEDVNEKGVALKILGFFTLNFFMFLLTLVGRYTDGELGQVLFIKAEILMLIPFILSLPISLYYVVKVIEIRTKRVLSYYYYNQLMLFMTLLLFVQIEGLLIAFAASILGSLLALLFYIPLVVLAIVERRNWFLRTTLKSLYDVKEFHNPLGVFLEKFSIYAKRYGGIVILLIAVGRMIFPFNKEDMYRNDLFRTLALIFSPFIGILSFYFAIALGSESIKGYYLKKYLEEYRLLSGYSVEEWYGKKSKQAKEEARKS